MVEWTKEQQNEFTALYKKYEQQPHYNKETAYKELFSKQLPYHESRSKLLNLIAGREKEAGLEARINGSETKSAFASFFEDIGRVFSNPLVSATVTALALLYIGIPYIP